MHLPYTLPLPPGFSLRDTLTCGQCFRWRENPDGSFTGFAGSRPAALFQQGDTLFLSDADTAFWSRYLDLDEDYGRWNEAFGADPTLRAAIRFCGGIRILRQDPWEAVLSFIISANNNIPRIQGIIGRLCDNFGEGGRVPLRPAAGRGDAREPGAAAGGLPGKIHPRRRREGGVRGSRPG